MRYGGVPEKETPEFISPLLWPPNSQDLNSVDYSMCMEHTAGENAQNTRH